MIPYDPKSWLRITLQVRSTVIPRLLGRLLFLASLTVILLIIRTEVPGGEGFFKVFKPLGHTLVGVALGLMIVFRTNCSYDRFWEGRKLWGGLTNASRNLMRGAAVAALKPINFDCRVSTITGQETPTAARAETRSPDL